MTPYFSVSSIFFIYPVGIQRNDISPHFWLRGNHGISFNLVPVGTEVCQPQIVVDKFKAKEEKQYLILPETSCCYTWRTIMVMNKLQRWIGFETQTFIKVNHSVLLTLSRHTGQKQCTLSPHSSWCDGKDPLQRF